MEILTALLTFLGGLLFFAFSLSVKIHWGAGGIEVSSRFRGKGKKKPPVK